MKISIFVTLSFIFVLLFSGFPSGVEAIKMVNRSIKAPHLGKHTT